VSLEEYRRKRSFEKTPEPGGAPKRKSSGRRFCLQRHDATRLHYDFRLELNGVLKSWAVPKGPSLTPGDKRLAVPTEDHPLGYIDWEGTIPAGQYGGGDVMVFDIGEWDPVESKDPEQSLRDGELKVRLWGQKIRGEWTLVRTRQDSWLWLKKNDSWANPEWNPEDHLWSAVSGRTFAELAQGLEAPAPRKRFPRGALKAAFPIEVEPMLASVAAPFSDPDWLFEVKWDGVRALAFCQQQSVRLSSRAGNSLTESFPELRLLRSRFAANSFVVDGELVVLDDEGRPHFSKILQRLKSPSASGIEKLARSARAVYYVFDLLYLDGRDLRGLPFEKRREVLAEVLRQDSGIRLSEAIPEEGESLYAAAVEQGLEGLVAKHRKGPYEAGRSSQWLKLKSRHTMDCAVLGYTPSKARQNPLGALFLGRYVEGALRLVGKVGSGFAASDLRWLKKALEPLAASTPPTPDAKKVKEKVTWLTPKLVVEVEYAEVTPDGNLRQASFVRVREDLAVEDCGDDPVPVTRDFRDVAGRHVAFSSPDKVLFPKPAYQKVQLAEYYERVAPLILPHLAGRPLSLRRYPDGVDGPEFFQKHPGNGVPEWVRRETWEHGEALMVDSPATLTVLSNLAAIELHVTMSRFPDLKVPDGVLIDFDPQSLAFPEVKKVAISAGKLLEELGWTSYLKTTGSRGIHVFVPVAAGYTFEQTRLMAAVMGEILRKHHPKKVTLERVPAKRPKGTVYIDAPQNRYTSTMASAYSVRANDFAGVSMPLRWKDLDSDVMPQDFTLATAARQARATAALWSMQPLEEQRIEDALPLLDERLQ
jgi:bifunctional non-homologous end joining protein LigD